jgi:hypothetical protein
MAKNAREQTQQSLRDGFGGDTYRRREIEPGRYQCGCRWARAEDVPEAFEAGVRGDVLLQCPIHAAATMVKA